MRIPRRLQVAAMVSVLIAGCAASGRDAEPPEQGLGPAERVAALLAGRYAGQLRDRDGTAETPVRLRAEIGRADADGVPVRMVQRTGRGDARRFGLVLEPTRVATRLAGRFSPLDEDGRAIGVCPLSVDVRNNGFVATTSAETCRFGSGAQQRALIKEIAHDGHRLIIADRVLGPDGAGTGPDRVLELQRVRTFSGWAGVRASDDAAWRVAAAFDLESDGVARDPADAAGMSLGLSLELAPHRVRAGEPPVLRLRVFDRVTGELIAQSWADPMATRIGVALSTVQVGLRLWPESASRR